MKITIIIKSWRCLPPSQADCLDDHLVDITAVSVLDSGIDEVEDLMDFRSTAKNHFSLIGFLLTGTGGGGAER